MKKLFGIAMLLLVVHPVSAKDPEVLIKTSHGDVTVRLFAEKAPITVDNFLSYVDSGFYNGTIFHRVIPRFMVQGGGFNARMQEQTPGEPIKNEAKNRLHNERGTLAMARTNDPDSATSQFFINLRNNFRLDWSPSNPGYTVFGEVTDGMYAVDSIAIEPTQNFMGHGDVPITPITITEIVRIGEPAAKEAGETVSIEPVVDNE